MAIFITGWCKQLHRSQAHTVKLDTYGMTFNELMRPPQCAWFRFRSERTGEVMELALDATEADEVRLALHEFLQRRLG